MKYICIYEGSVSEPFSTLKEAFDDYTDSFGEDPLPEECTFYEVGEPLEVEIKIEKKVIHKVTKITEKAK